MEGLTSLSNAIQDVKEEGVDFNFSFDPVTSMWLGFALGFFVFIGCVAAAVVIAKTVK